MNMVSALIIVLGSYGLVQIFDNNLFFKNFVESILKVQGLPGTAVLMLPLGYSIGVVFNLIVHWWGFGRHFPSFSKPVKKTLFQVVGASTIMVYVTYHFLPIFDRVFDVNTLVGIFSQGFFAGVVGIGSAVFVLYLLGSRELTEVWSTLHKKIWKAKIIAPDAELQ